MSAIVQQAYHDEVLDEAVHSRLVQDIDRISMTSNIPVGMILKSMKDYCTEEEVEWVKHLWTRDENEKMNLAYIGSNTDKPIETRMMAMGGACLRNFIDARLYTAQEMVRGIDQGKTPNPSVLMIPNFFIGKDQGGHISSWHVSSLLGLLISRLAAKRVTVLYIDNLKALEAEYGKAFVQHVKNYYHLIN